MRRSELCLQSLSAILPVYIIKKQSWSFEIILKIVNLKANIMWWVFWLFVVCFFFFCLLIPELLGYIQVTYQTFCYDKEKIFTLSFQLVIICIQELKF